MIDYYAKRAGEYEQIYRKPERQADLRLLSDFVKRELAGRRVLEVACGTGYWTEIAASTAHSILATDLHEEVLAIARAKNLPSGKVAFEPRDAYHPDMSGDFDAGLACFWWSHVPLHRLSRFLSDFHASLAPGARVVFIDNRFVPGSSSPISESDAEGNTYQLRHLSDGSVHRVLKNFPSPDFIRSTLHTRSNSVAVTEFDDFWCATYTLDKTND